MSEILQDLRHAQQRVLPHLRRKHRDFGSAQSAFFSIWKKLREPINYARVLKDASTAYSATIPDELVQIVIGDFIGLGYAAPADLASSLREWSRTWQRPSEVERMTDYEAVQFAVNQWLPTPESKQPAVVAATASLGVPASIADIPGDHFDPSTEYDGDLDDDRHKQGVLSNDGIKAIENLCSSDVLNALWLAVRYHYLGRAGTNINETWHRYLNSMLHSHSGTMSVLLLSSILGMAVLQWNLHRANLLR